MVTLFLGNDFVITAKDILINWLMSGLIGVASLIFEGNGSFRLYLFIHYLLISLIVNIAALGGHWVNPAINDLGLLNLLIFVIYLLVWGILYLSDILNVSRINQQLRRKKNK